MSSDHNIIMRSRIRENLFRSGKKKYKRVAKIYYYSNREHERNEIIRRTT